MDSDDFSDFHRGIFVFGEGISISEPLTASECVLNGGLNGWKSK